jgi:tellurite resistance protein
MPLFSGSGSSQGSLFSTAGAHTPFDLDKLAQRYRHRDLGWALPEAYLTILILAADCDGPLKAEERLEIEIIARRSPALRAMIETGELGRHEQSAQNKIRQNKQAALDEACLSMPEEMGLSVFAHCVHLMLADGEFNQAERGWIEALYPKLAISEEYARRIVEVLLLKGRY